MKREIGYYWVKHFGKWVISYFDEGWSLNANKTLFYDNDFDEIDENRITRESVSTRINEIQKDWDELRGKLFGLL